MRRKRAFIPTSLDRLERRVVLSRTALATPVVVSGLYPNQGVLNHQQQSVAAEINQEFDSFANDYDQARATYFTSIQGQTNPSLATTNAMVRLYDATGLPARTGSPQHVRADEALPRADQEPETARRHKDHRGPCADSAGLARAGAARDAPSARHDRADVLALLVEPG